MFFEDWESFWWKGQPFRTWEQGLSERAAVFFCFLQFWAWTSTLTADMVREDFVALNMPNKSASYYASDWSWSWCPKVEVYVSMEADRGDAMEITPKKLNFNFWTGSSTLATDIVRATLKANILGNKMMSYHVSHLSWTWGSKLNFKLKIACGRQWRPVFMAKNFNACSQLQLQLQYPQTLYDSERSEYGLKNCVCHPPLNSALFRSYLAFYFYQKANVNFFPSDSGEYFNFAPSNLQNYVQ